MASNPKKTKIKFGFVPCPSNIQLPMCLLCKKTLTKEAMKLSRLKDHLSRIHPDKVDKPIAFFQALKEDHARSTIRNVFARKGDQNVKGLIASYKVSLLIAKKGLPFTVGESLLVPAVKEIISTVMEKDSAPVLQAIPLSDTTVKRRIDEMGANIEEQLCEVLQKLFLAYNWTKPQRQTTMPC